jgi:glycosyltransferase involved in cell wall biosynthesis
MTAYPVTISIVTATLNSAATIEKTIQSVRRQAHRVHQHIIIDGGSSDGTLDIIKSFQSRYPLQWLSAPDRGIADAMNKGVRLANGAYILVLHSDDYLRAPDSIATAATYLQNEICDIFAAPVLVEYGDGCRHLRRPYRALWWYHFKTPFCHQGSLVHRRLFDRLGGFREDFSIAMDYDFFYRALKLKPFIFYHHRPLSIMGAYGIGTRQDMALKRIDEEYQVQRRNEGNPVWKVLQFLFRLAYRPYKSAQLERNRRRHQSRERP